MYARAGHRGSTMTGLGTHAGLALPLKIDGLVSAAASGGV